MQPNNIKQLNPYKITKLKKKKSLNIGIYHKISQEFKILKHFHKYVTPLLYFFGIYPRKNTQLKCTKNVLDLKCKYNIIKILQLLPITFIMTTLLT